MYIHIEHQDVGQAKGRVTDSGAVSGFLRGRGHSSGLSGLSGSGRGLLSRRHSSDGEDGDNFNFEAGDFVVDRKLVGCA
jgi:hypothetical protein